MTARAFGIPISYIAPVTGSSRLAKTLRYALSLPMTALTLARARPKVVFFLNQPMLLLITVWIYTRITGGRFVLDCHSAPYERREGSTKKLYAAATRAAAVNLNHNRIDTVAAEQMGGLSILFPDIPLSITLSSGLEIPKVRSPNVLVICSFTADEPLDIIIEAARLLPECIFYITGNWRKRAEDVARAPDNVVLLGFLSRETYLAYMVASDVVVTLSVRSHIMQMAADEALSLGCPLVTNHSPILEEIFGEAAIFTLLVPSALAKAIGLAQANGKELRRRMLARRLERERELVRTVARVLRQLDLVD